MEATTAPAETTPQRVIDAPIEPPAPSIGRIVHYVLGPHDPVHEHCRGEHRPAVIVRTRGPDLGSAVNLQVFLDGTNDVPIGPPGSSTLTLWKTSVSYDPHHHGGTWHWPERV